MSVLTGQTTDISALLLFFFWEPVYFPTGDSLPYAHKPCFPSDTAERLGRFVGFEESVGDALTFKILTDDTQKIMYRSSIRTALSEEEREDIGKQADRNVRAEPAPTESPTTDIDSPDREGSRSETRLHRS